MISQQSISISEEREKMEEMVGIYQISNFLGEGAQGTVWLGYDGRMKRQVAIKISKGEMLPMLRKEKEALVEYSHPILPSVYDYWEEENRGILVLEYIEGRTIESILEDKCLEEKEAVGIILELLSWLEQLHKGERPAIYCDLKPSNVILQSQGRVRVVDMGAVLQKGMHAPQYGGTPGYSAPELWEGIVSEACDIYSIGALLHVMLTREYPERPPFVRRSIRECNSSLSPALETIIKSCLMERAVLRLSDTTVVKKSLSGYQEKDQRRSFFRKISKIPFYLIFLWILWRGYLGAQCIIWDIPQTYVGILAQTILEITVLFTVKWFFLEKGRNESRYTLVQNVWKTGKRIKGTGFLGCLGIMLLLGQSTSEEVAAKEERSSLPIEIYNEIGQKICVRFDSVLEIEDDLHFAIPKELLEEGEISQVILSVRDANGERSRFLEVKVCN